MIDPKTFYRNMDDLVARIEYTSEDVTFVPSAMEALEGAFGTDLRFGDGRVYLEDDQVFVHEYPERPEVSMSQALPFRAPAVQNVLRHGSYIFDDPLAFPELELKPRNGYGVPVAFAINRSPRRRWLIVFMLRDGWIREEISLCMNAVRFVLNTRILSENVKGDLEQAAEIQSSLIPDAAPEFGGYEIAARSIPAEVVGGDFYDFIPQGDEILGVSFGDASGHGLPAALLVRDVVTGLRMGIEVQMKLLHTLRKLNRVIHRSSLSSRFVSLFYAEIENNGSVLYANAGHTSPLVMTSEGIVELEPTGTVLGPLAELPISRAYARLKPGDVLFGYSDGLIAMGPLIMNCGIVLT